MSREESSLNEIDVTRENHAPLLILVLHSVIVLHIFISRGTFTIIGTYLSFIFRVGRGGGGGGHSQVLQYFQREFVSESQVVIPCNTLLTVHCVVINQKATNSKLCLLYSFPSCLLF